MTDTKRLGFDSKLVHAGAPKDAYGNAVTTAYLALLGGGDHIVSTAAVYGPSRTLMEKQLSRFGLSATRAGVPQSERAIVGIENVSDLIEDLR